MDLGFLDEIEIDSDKNIKSIRFREEEIYLIKFVRYKRRNFSSYVKELIRKDLENYVAIGDGVRRADLGKVIKKIIEE